MVRVEAGLIFSGYDFSDETDPFEAGIGFTVPLKSKMADFIGREALIRRKEHPSRKLVGLHIEANVDVGHGDCVYADRAQIGVVTSSVRSPILGKNVACLPRSFRCRITILKKRVPSLKLSMFRPQL
jgi:aminomethyltransferase